MHRYHRLPSPPLTQHWRVEDGQSGGFESQFKAEDWAIPRQLLDGLEELALRHHHDHLQHHDQQQPDHQRRDQQRHNRRRQATADGAAARSADERVEGKGLRGGGARDPVEEEGAKEGGGTVEGEGEGEGEAQERRRPTLVIATNSRQAQLMAVTHFQHKYPNSTGPFDVVVAQALMGDVHVAAQAWVNKKNEKSYRRDDWQQVRAKRRASEAQMLRDWWLIAASDVLVVCGEQGSGFSASASLVAPYVTGKLQHLYHYTEKRGIIPADPATGQCAGRYC